MNSKYTIQCNSCQNSFSRWKHEIDKIKDVSLYTCKACKSKNCRDTKICPICSKQFSFLKKESKVTCSYACSNKYFRTGSNNGNWKVDVYRSTCFEHHKKECVVCRENKIVEVHHYDHNHKNNQIENLIPLCPTHHKYMHSRYAKEISNIIDAYYNSFIKNVISKT